MKYTHGKDAWNMKRQRQYQIYLRPVLSARLLINPRVSRASPTSHLCAAYHARPVNGLHSALNTLWKVRLLYVSPGHMIILNLNKFNLLDIPSLKVSSVRFASTDSKSKSSSTLQKSSAQSRRKIEFHR